MVHKTGFIKVFYFACNVLEDLNRLEATCDFATNGPIYDMWIIMLAAFSILRLLRSELKPYLDAKRGEQAYLTGIHLHRKRSVQNNDLQARGAVIMTQLWSSERIFKRADGLTDCLRLRIRNRLVGPTNKILPYNFPFGTRSNLTCSSSPSAWCSTVIGGGALNSGARRISSRHRRMNRA